MSLRNSVWVEFNTPMTAVFFPFYFFARDEASLVVAVIAMRVAYLIERNGLRIKGDPGKGKTMLEAAAGDEGAALQRLSARTGLLRPVRTAGQVATTLHIVQYS